jgi:hypothetical protein
MTDIKDLMKQAPKVEEGSNYRAPAKRNIGERTGLGYGEYLAHVFVANEENDSKDKINDATIVEMIKQEFPNMAEDLQKRRVKKKSTVVRRVTLGNDVRRYRLLYNNRKAYRDQEEVKYLSLRYNDDHKPMNPDNEWITHTAFKSRCGCFQYPINDPRIKKPPKGFFNDGSEE